MEFKFKLIAVAVLFIGSNPSCSHFSRLQADTHKNQWRNLELQRTAFERQLFFLLSTVHADSNYFHVLNWLLHTHQAFAENGYVAYRFSTFLASNWLYNIFAIRLSYTSNYSCSLIFLTILWLIILANFKTALRNGVGIGQSPLL